MTELTRRIASSKAAKTDAPFANGANIASLISWMGVPNVVIVLGNLLTRPSTCAAAFCRFAYIAEGFRTWTPPRRCFSLFPLSPSRCPFVSIRVHSWFLSFFVYFVCFVVNPCLCHSCPFVSIRGSIHSCPFVSIRGSLASRVFRGSSPLPIAIRGS